MSTHRLLHGLFIAAALSVISSAVAAQTLEEVRALAGAGAPHLALRVMDRRQQQMTDNPEQWLRWERERINTYQKAGEWTALAERLAELPQDVSLEFRLWAHTQRANALLELGRGEQARRALRQALWQLGDRSESAPYLGHWQRLIMRGYVLEGRAADARTAAMRYQQEYGWSGEVADLRLQARILLMSDRPGEAVDLLKPQVKDPQIHALYLLARLRSARQSASKVLGASLEELRSGQYEAQHKVYFWAVAAEAAQVVGDRATAANAMEHLLVGREHLRLPGELVRVDAQRMWRAYLEHATHLGNKSHLLIGQDARWLTYAEDIAPRLPVSARSVYAFVLSRSRDPEHRTNAAKAYARLALKRDQGEALLQRLFLESPAFAERRKIPEPIRHALVDIALGESDLPLASQLMATISEPPPGTDNFMWHLRRARILVLGGNSDQGAKALHGILDKNAQLSATQLDRYLQVVFDLQSADAHEAAVDLFERLFSFTEQTKIQRELLYWMAESRKAQEQYTEAARLYLKSAMHPDPEKMDPWAQTAHYQAAEALASGGFVRDARNLYRQLLTVTDDASRRAVLKRELQKLWLVEDKSQQAESKEEL